MESKFQTSFIPKRPVVTSMEAPIAVRHPLNLLSIIFSAVFIIVVLGAAGEFVYERYLDSTISKLSGELTSAQSSIQNDLIDQFVRLDSRINTAEALMNGHIAISRVFDTLQNETVRDIQFSNMTYSTDQSGNISILLHGVAQNYNAIAYQSQVFSQGPYFKNPVFADMSLNEKGDVLFSVKAVLNSQDLAITSRPSAGQQTSNQ